SERGLIGVHGVGDEVDTPLPSQCASDAAVRDVLVEGDHVTRRCLDDDGVTHLSDMRAGPDPKRTGVGGQRFEVGDEAEARYRHVAVNVPVGATEVLRSLRASGKYVPA